MTNGHAEIGLFVSDSKRGYTQFCGKVLLVVYWLKHWGQRAHLCACVCVIEPVCGWQEWSVESAWGDGLSTMEIKSKHRRGRQLCWKKSYCFSQVSLFSSGNLIIISLNICHKNFCLRSFIHMFIIFFCTKTTQSHLKLLIYVKGCLYLTTFSNFLSRDSLFLPNTPLSAVAHRKLNYSNH